MKIFCSGIGGIGLSAYAAYQKHCGHDVSGSDREQSAILSDLQSQDIAVSLIQDGSAIPEDIDLFVYTLALPEDHPEREKAAALGIPQKTYFEALGDLTKKHTLIAVCGTHGKSSTTAMAAKVLIEAGLDPSVILGTKTADLQGRNWRKGASTLFLVEACEYRRSFLHLSPQIILLTNISGDHFDVFTDMADYESAFREFIALLPAQGKLITHTPKTFPGVHTIGTSSLPLPKLRVPGIHMQENAQLVLALAELLGISAQDSLSAYQGCWRRMEVREEKEGVLIIDDYGHHPREISVTLQALKEAYPERRLVCVFQPHTHNRTLKLYDDFLSSFSAADLVILPNVYAARADLDREQVDIDQFVEDIAKTSDVSVRNGISLEETARMLSTELQKGDLLITMGAGDVRMVGDLLMQE